MQRLEISAVSKKSRPLAAFSDLFRGWSVHFGVTTPYRNEIDALNERRTSLQAEIARLREQTTHLDELRSREAALAAELAGVEGRLAAGTPKRALPLLDQVRIASPCKADWNEMVGDERVRFCLSCEKNVYNLSSMQRDDAEALLRERLGNDVCVRFYQRADGTILTQDCPEGVKKKRRKKLALAVAGAGAMAAAAATMFFKTTCMQGKPVAGAVSYQGEPMMGAVVEAHEPSVVPPAAPPTPETATPTPREPGQWMAGKPQVSTPRKRPTPKSVKTPPPVDALEIMGRP